MRWLIPVQHQIAAMHAPVEQLASEWWYKLIYTGVCKQQCKGLLLKNVSNRYPQVRENFTALSCFVSVAY